MSKKKSTSKNPNSFVVPKPIIFLGKTIQFFSKDLATLFAAKLFSTPVRHKAPERELTMRTSAKNESLSLPKSKKELNVYIYGYSKRKILLVHGWAGRGTQLYQIADKILENRMMVISFDGPAHGLSSGKTTNMIEFLEAIEEVNKKYGPFEAVVGHSFGAMSLINSVAKGLNTDKLVVIGADNSIPRIFRYFVKKLELKPVIADKLRLLFEKKYHASLDSFTSEVNAFNIDIPTFVIHDSEDKYVNVSSAIAIRQNLKKGDLLMTNGLGHHKIFKNPMVINRIIDFIK